MLQVPLQKKATSTVSIEIQLDQNSLADEMRTRGNERVSVRQGYDYGRYGTLNEANLLKTVRISVAARTKKIWVGTWVLHKD
jgi:hypothetical protein